MRGHQAQTVTCRPDKAPRKGDAETEEEGRERRELGSKGQEDVTSQTDGDAVTPPEPQKEKDTQTKLSRRTPTLRETQPETM